MHFFALLLCQFNIKSTLFLRMFYMHIVKHDHNIAISHLQLPWNISHLVGPCQPFFLYNPLSPNSVFLRGKARVLNHRFDYRWFRQSVKIKTAWLSIRDDTAGSEWRGKADSRILQVALYHANECRFYCVVGGVEQGSLGVEITWIRLFDNIIYGMICWW